MVILTQLHNSRSKKTSGGAMYLYVEMWNAKPSWLALSLPERQQFMAKVAEAAKGLQPLGAEVLGAWINDEDVDHRLGKTYFTAFRFPDKEAVQGFEAIVRESGWYDLFEQTNASGRIDTFANVMEHALSL
jgi:hypothetical protein